MGDGRRLLTVHEVAEMFRVTEYTVREWLRDPEVSLAGFRTKNGRGQWRVRESEAERFAQERYGNNV